MIKKLFLCLSAGLLTAAFSLSAAASTAPYQSYVYDH